MCLHCPSEESGTRGLCTACNANRWIAMQYPRKVTPNVMSGCTGVMYGLGATNDRLYSLAKKEFQPPQEGAVKVADKNCYFAYRHPPIHRELVCPMCGDAQRIQDVFAAKTVEWKGDHFSGTCLKCNRPIIFFSVSDRPQTLGADSLTYHVSSDRVWTVHDPQSRKTTYVWDLPDHIRKAVLAGDEGVLATRHWDVIMAAARGKMLHFFDGVLTRHKYRAIATDDQEAPARLQKARALGKDEPDGDCCQGTIKAKVIRDYDISNSLVSKKPEQLSVVSGMHFEGDKITSVEKTFLNIDPDGKVTVIGASNELVEPACSYQEKGQLPEDEKVKITSANGMPIWLPANFCLSCQEGHSEATVTELLARGGYLWKSGEFMAFCYVCGKNRLFVPPSTLPRKAVSWKEYVENGMWQREEPIQIEDMAKAATSQPYSLGAQVTPETVQKYKQIWGDPSEPYTKAQIEHAAEELRDKNRQKVSQAYLDKVNHAYITHTGPEKTDPAYLKHQAECVADFVMKRSAYERPRILIELAKKRPQLAELLLEEVLQRTEQEAKTPLE